jgi:two-component system chemotaxis response regulator CheB
MADSGKKILASVVDGSAMSRKLLCGIPNTELDIEAAAGGLIRQHNPNMIMQNSITRFSEEIRSKAGIAAPPAAPEKKPPAGLPVDRIIAIGASTGGVEAVTAILTQFPAECPAVLVTQHMPEKFTASFAQRLNAMCAVNVKEAVDGDIILSGHAYVAPGGKHLELSRAAIGYVCKITQGPPVSGHRPSVDVLFHSVALAAGKKAVGVILTGMGRDGTEGLLAMRKAGCMTFGQDEATCVVYGMPKAAFEQGAVDRQLPLGQMAPELLLAARPTAGAT